MNLIEQLGGYEKAKVMLRGLGNEYESALLQYRREHNIYDVGDKVVRLDNDNPYIYTIQKVDSDCITIVRKKKSNAVKTWGMWISHNELRHATTQEIAQGYRDK